MPKLPVREQSILAINLAVEVLPFVPTTCTEGKLSCGSLRTLQSFFMLSREGFIPNLSSPSMKLTARSNVNFNFRAHAPGFNASICDSILLLISSSEAIFSLCLRTISGGALVRKSLLSSLLCMKSISFPTFSRSL